MGPEPRWDGEYHAGRLLGGCVSSLRDLECRSGALVGLQGSQIGRRRATSWRANGNGVFDYGKEMSSNTLGSIKNSDLLVWK